MPERKSSRVIISVPEAKKILERLDMEAADQIQKRTYDYATKFSKTSPEKAAKIRSLLEKECGLTDEEAAEVTNILPKSIEELRAFTAGWRKLLPTEVVERIIKIIDENA